ncbi:MAG TPA: TetR/AcrR family transcriptional regulator [Myxococcota bacterium]|nr:TetR/AcrR family transcriptional regulator [Myxococcota bacterium]
MARAPGKRSERSRKRILDSARAVFFEQGFERANLDLVARKAGLAKGTIYRHFDSKAELYVEVLIQNASAFLERMRRVVDPGQGAEEQIRRLARFYFDHYTSQLEYFRIFWAIDNQRLIGELPPSVVAGVTEVWKRALQILADVIERGVASGELAPCDPWLTANVVWVGANAVIQTLEVPARRELWERDVAKVYGQTIDLYLRGLRATVRDALTSPEASMKLKTVEK